MKLWKKDVDVNKEIEKFTVGNDYKLDKELVYYDCIASIAHAKMLNKIGILTQDELDKLIQSLNDIINSGLEIKQEDEDCHTAIENYLTQKYGDIGKKIHTARSRNDQVLTAMRLYEKDKLKELLDLLDNVIKSIKDKENEYGTIKLPGYTHMQKAMPTTIKMWFNAYISSLEDDKISVKNALTIIDKSPLGNAAGFGTPIINLDNDMTAKELGFSKVQDTMYCQNSRGKYETLIVDTLMQIMMSLNKISTDLITFSMKEFGYFSLPEEFCTGSSIMPQKKNPDVLELVRAKYSVILGYNTQLKSIYSNLISGYNRDMQLTKEPTMKSLDITKECLKIINLVFNGLKINKESCEKALTKEIYATEETYKLVKQGIPFRDAYKEVAKRF